MKTFGIGLLAITLLFGASVCFAEEPMNTSPKPKKTHLDKQLKKAIEDTVRQRLSSPEGARFRNIRLVKGAAMFCGEVHPKSDTDYTGVSSGFRPFRGIIHKWSKNIRVYIMEMADDDDAKIEAILATCKRYEQNKAPMPAPDSKKPEKEKAH